MIPDFLLLMTFTPEEFDELERCLKTVEKADYINLLCDEHNKNRKLLSQRNKIQNAIIGKFMDVKRKKKEEGHQKCR